jgi:colicin import membrane protein
MARKLKVYQTALGFFDQAVAVPSMKAALEAWGSNSNLFHQGAARETDDPEIVAATMAKPGVVLRRAVGSSGPFTEHAALPTDLACVSGRPKKPATKRKKRTPGRIDDQAAREAAPANHGTYVPGLPAQRPARGDPEPLSSPGRSALAAAAFHTRRED